MGAKYRPDIDGLRAIAVVSVVLFHAGVSQFSGGYLGVDVFFVISGYLISRIIFSEIEADRFSLARFYERRARRILPALFAVLVIVSVASIVGLLPYDLKQYGKSLAAVPAFLSNFIFWLAGGYFAPPSQTEPLLHTWSLAIEEQFYVLFPILLVCLARFGRRVVVVGLSLLGIASFTSAVVLTQLNSNTAFYMPYTRAWELMLGAFIALDLGRVKSAVAGAALASLGILFVCCGIVGIANLPGPPAVVVCLGAALLIYGGTHQNFASDALGIKPVVFVGLTSYSLYLWHWPFIVFGSYYVLNPQWIGPAKIIAAASSFPVAYLSWRYIENPFRHRNGVFDRPKLFKAALVLSIAFSLAGVVLWRLNGLPERFSPQLAALTPKHSDNNVDCDGQKRCIIGDDSVRPSFALWGDSHAQALNDALNDFARRAHVSGYVFYNLGCRPFLNSLATTSCLPKNQAVSAALKQIKVKSVLITADWSGVPRGTNRADLMPSVESIVHAAAVNGAQVYLMLDVPHADESVPETMQKQLIVGSRRDVLRIPVSEYVGENELMYSASAKISAARKATILDPKSLFCGREFCEFSRGGLPLYNDTNHVNRRGANLIVGRLFAAVLAPHQRIEELRLGGVFNSR
jgi:peptidoglycan/LPS O-acetylase OafA/YrhL